MSQQALKKRLINSESTMLYDYQLDVLLKAETSWLYALDTGTGKTILSLHHYLLHNRGEPLLIVAPPQKIKEGGWDRDIQTVVNYYETEIQYEMLSYGSLANKFQNYKGWFVIYDECHYIKTSTSGRGKAAVKLSNQSTDVLLLSATPSSNGWGDAINYFVMFGLAKNKTRFEQEYGEFKTLHLGTRKVNQVASWKNEEFLQAMYRSFSVKLAKEDCLDLPTLTVLNVDFTASKEYKVIKKDRVLALPDETIIYDTQGKLSAGLRYYANQHDKLQHLEMMFEGTQENIIVFYHFKAEKESILALCKKMKKKAYEVSGQKSSLPKRDVWVELKNTVTVVQYQAGAAGIELQYASLVVFYTPTYSLQDYEQSLGRAYRNGQTKPVTVYRFVTLKTIEVAVYAALSEKKDFTDALFQKYIGG